MKEVDGRSEKVYRDVRISDGICTESTVVSSISTELEYTAYGRMVLSRIHPRVVSSLTISRKIIASGTSAPVFIKCSALMPASH
jgi:hypothetical protein